MTNPTTWFQLGLIGDAGPEIRNGLGVFLYLVRSKLNFDRMLGTGLSRAIIKASTALSTETWRGDEVVRLRHLAAREAHASLEHTGPTEEQ